jgi:hypothetical protein
MNDVRAPQVEPAAEIPDDGLEHSCPCGSSGYRAWDGDGWLRELVVTDDEGRTVEYCHRCERDLVAVKPKEPS